MPRDPLRLTFENPRIGGECSRTRRPLPCGGQRSSRSGFQHDCTTAKREIRDPDDQRIALATQKRMPAPFRARLGEREGQWAKGPFERSAFFDVQEWKGLAGGRRASHG